MKTYSVIKDRDGWFRVARDGRALPPRMTRSGRVLRWNLYRTVQAAKSALRSILSKEEGE